MDFQEAIRKIEERGDFNRFAEVKPVFENRLTELKEGDHTERGLCYYYLLVSYLKAHLVHETSECVDFFERMQSAFLEQEEVYRIDRHKFSWSEMKDFFHLMDRCFGSLEFLYLKHDFKVRRLEATRQKMRFRKDAFLFNRQYARWFEYSVYEVTSDYGTNLYRWSLTTLSFIIFMAFAYAVGDHFTAPAERIISEAGHWFDYFYFSMVTLTTVGYGDITPIAPIGKMLAMLESFFGFLILGIFIGLVQKRM